MFSPLAFPSGRLLFDLTTAYPPESHIALFPFELYRTPLAIVGIADGQNAPEDAIDGLKASTSDSEESIGSNITTFLNNLSQDRETMIGNFSKALVHQIMVFDLESASNRLPEGICFVPSPAKSKVTTVKTIMCDLASQILGGMTSLAKSIQASTTLESPRTSGSSVYRPLAEYAVSSRPTSAERNQRPFSPANEPQKQDYRKSMPAHILSNLGSRSSTPDSRATSPPSRVRTPPTTFEEMPGTPGSSPPPKRAEIRRPTSQDLGSMQGFGSGDRERIKLQGRIGIAVGAMFLLAGRWPDAVKELVEGATLARAYNDHAWHAKALDYLLVCCLMYAWADMDFRIPQVMYPTAEKSGAKSSHTPSNSLPDLSATASSNSNRDASLRSLAALLPELVNVILNLYARAWTFSDDKIPQLVFSESGIRFSKLLVPIERSDGRIDENVLKCVVLNVVFEPKKTDPDQTATFPTKADITAFLFRAFPKSRSDTSMTTADRTVILSGIASVLSELGHHRKKAFVFKEILSGLVPALIQARKNGAAELGVHPAASLASLDAALDGQRSQSLEVPYRESEPGMQSFLALICSSFGILLATNDGAHQDHNTEDPDASVLNSSEAVAYHATQHAYSKSFGSQELKTHVLQLCISICEALPDLGGILRFSAELLRTCGSGKAPGSDSSNSAPFLDAEDQLRLSNKISRTVSAAKQFGLENLETEYWDDFLVRGIEFINPSSSKTPSPHARNELEVVATIETEAKKDPFLYNPFLQAKTKAAKPLLVANEEAIFQVTLQNMYDFDLEIESIELECDGISFAAASQGATIGPYRTQGLFLTGIPSSAGALKLTGCIAKIKGCRRRRFPLFEKSWALKKDVKVKHTALTNSMVERPSDISLEPNTAKSKPTKGLTGPITSSISVDVIGVQPQVVVKSISLPQSALMLLEGETKVFTVTLRNVSQTVAADLLLLSFDDSTAAQLQAAMNSNELSPTDFYELELASSKKPLRWRRGDIDPDPMIGPSQELTLDIEVVGKPGLSHGTIQADYGYIGGSRTSVKDRFYTRQVSIPLTITVNASVDLARTNLLPFSSTFAWRNQQRLLALPPSASEKPSPSTHRQSLTPRSSNHKSKTVDNRFQALLQRIGISPNSETQHCLLLLDCRNSWPTPLSISIQIRSSSSSFSSPSTTSTDSPHNGSAAATDPWKRAYTVHETIHPGHTARLVLLLPRLRIQNPYAPIPHLDPRTKRQFVVGSGKDSNDLEAQMKAREAFWFREEILSLMRATWTEEKTGRTGEVNLRNLRLGPKMVEAVRMPEVEIRMEVSLGNRSSNNKKRRSESSEEGEEGEEEEEEHGTIEQTGPTTYVVPLHMPLILTVTLTNRLLAPIHPLLRLQPLVAGPHPHHVALDLGRKFLVHGSLQQVMPVLQPGESKT
ncbi:MAG: hypothetical protein Q9167_007771, partial [Letrouitia subvulpina]